MSLERAPEHIKIAVDLIQLLEESNVKTATVLAALQIVKSDFKRKLTDQDAQNLTK